MNKHKTSYESQYKATRYYPGGSRCRVPSGWYAVRKVNGEEIKKGPFPCELDAAEASDKIALKYQEKKQKLNFPSRRNEFLRDIQLQAHDEQERRKRKRKFEVRQKAKDSAYHSSDSDIEEDEEWSLARVRARIKSKSSATFPTSSIQQTMKKSSTSPKRKPIRRAKADRVTPKSSKESIQSSTLKTFSTGNVLIKRGQETLCEGRRISDADNLTVIEIQAASDAEGLEEIPLCEWKQCAFCCCIDEMPTKDGDVIKVFSESSGVYYGKVSKNTGFFHGRDGLAHKRIYFQPISLPGGASFKEVPITKLVNNPKNMKFSFTRATEDDGAYTQFPAGTLVKIGGKKLEKIKALFELEDEDCKGQVMKVREKKPRFHVRLASEESLWVSANDLINDGTLRYCAKKIEEAESGSKDVALKKSNMENEVAELKISIEKKMEEKLKNNKEMSDQQMEITNLEEELNQLEEKLTAIRTALKTKQESSCHLEKEVKLLKSTLAHKEEEINRASERLNHFRLLREDFKKEIKAQEATLKEPEVKKEMPQFCDFTNFRLVAELGSECMDHDFDDFPKEKEALEQTQKRKREPETPGKPPKRMKSKPSRLQTRPPLTSSKTSQKNEFVKPSSKFPPPPMNPRKKPSNFSVHISSNPYRKFRDVSKRTRKIPIPPQIEKTRKTANQ